MARRGETSPAEDIMDIVAMLPWWVGVMLALLSYLLLHSGQIDACIGAALGGTAGAAAAAEFEAERAGERSIPALACRMSPWSFGPSTRFTLRPFAKLAASSVNRPSALRAVAM